MRILDGGVVVDVAACDDISIGAAAILKYD